MTAVFFLFAFSLNAQAPAAVPIVKEPHHHLVLENDYVRVFRVSVPANDATLLHQHDLPYVYVALGPAEFTNAVAGTPDAHVTMTDGQVGYSPGHFAHIARTDAGSVFNNVTIELLHPQGDPHNLCAQVVVADPAGDCGDEPLGEKTDFVLLPQFETSEIRVDIARMGAKTKHTELATKLPLLIVGLRDSEVRAERKGQPDKTLRKGEIAWVNDDSGVTLSNSGKKPAALFQILFKNAKSSAKP